MFTVSGSRVGGSDEREGADPRLRDLRSGENGCRAPRTTSSQPRHGRSQVEESYRNMREVLDLWPDVAERARVAMRMAGSPTNG
jgi:hypothetical protein